MAIQFARIEYGSRGQGKNACLKAAYNAREAVKCERTGQLFSFKHRTDNVFHKILLPEGVDSRFKDSTTLWNAAENAEKRKDSQVYKECVIALPDDKVVTNEDRMEIAERFAEFVFVSKGLGCQIDIHSPHEGEKNWHAHFIVTTRRFREDGLALSSHKARDTDPEVRKGKVIEADAVGEIYADIQNAFFKEKGYDLRVDPISIVSQIHLGPLRMRTHMNSALERAEMLRTANEIAVRTPVCILKKLTEKQSSFTEGELDQFIAKQVAAKYIDLKEVPVIKEAVLRHENTVVLYDPETFEKTHRYTTIQVRREEEKFLRFADVVNERGRAVVREKSIQKVIHERKLSEEQVKALRFVTTSENGLSIIEGRAGVGKSHVLAAIRDAYQDQGYRVVGLAPTGAVATDMAKDDFKEAYTVHKMLFMYKNNRFSLNQNTVMIVDEAAMLGTSAYVELFNVAKSYKCKVILVGDDRQISSVDRGGAFSSLTEKMGSRELTQVRRQTIPWQKEVSESLGQGKVVKAIELLSENNALNWARTKAESMASLIQAWEKDHAQDPTQSKLILATRNVEVDALNTAIREIRLRRGEIEAKGYECHTLRGREVFSVGDRICLAQTDKTLGIVNGSFGYIKSLSETHCQAALDEGQEITFNPQTYHGLKLGYAATVYKSQGKTIDQVYVLHSNATQRLINYVALSRQTQLLQVFVNQEETRNKAYLIDQMSRNNGKTLSLKYLTEEQVNRAKTLGGGYWDAAKEVWVDLKTNVQNKLSDFFHENKEFYDIKGREQNQGWQQVVQVDSSSLKSQDPGEKQWVWVKDKQPLTQEGLPEESSSIRDISSSVNSNSKLVRIEPEDAQEISKQLTEEDRLHDSTPDRNQSVEEEKHWTPLFSVPENVLEPDITNTPHLSHIAKDKQITAMHEYKDRKGNLLGYVVRLEDQEGNKITPTLTYCENEKGEQNWRWQDFGEARPLYGQEKLVKHPTKPVLVIEGEKAANNAQKLFPDHVVISWPGGAREVEKANWGPLLGRNVTLWLDQTQAGLKTAQHIEDALKHINVTYRLKVDIKTVELPKDLSEKWNLTDDLLKNLSLRDLQNIVHKDHKEPDQEKILNLLRLPNYQQINELRMHEHLRDNHHHKAVPEKPAHEVEAMKFSERFSAYQLDCYRDHITKEQKTQFEKEVVSFMKNEKAVNYLKSIDPDMVKSLEQMNKHIEMLRARDFDLTR